MKEIKDMIFEQLSKMWADKSLAVGAISGGLSIAIPQWIFDKEGWTVNHTVLILIFAGLLVAEQLVGRRLATKSPVKQKTSDVMIDSLVRDFIMLGTCAAAYGLDFLFDTGSVLFVVAVVSFMYHNAYSLMANIMVLGWGKHFPIWLLKWLDNEIKAKANKYFPDANIETELNQKINKIEIDEDESIDMTRRF